MAAKEAVIWPALTVACLMARRPGDFDWSSEPPAKHVGHTCELLLRRRLFLISKNKILERQQHFVLWGTFFLPFFIFNFFFFALHSATTCSQKEGQLHSGWRRPTALAGLQVTSYTGLKTDILELRMNILWCDGLGSSLKWCWRWRCPLSKCQCWAIWDIVDVSWKGPPRRL